MSKQLRFVSPRDRVLFLRSSPNFNSVKTSELMEVARHMREVYQKKGSKLYSQGDPLHSAYLLVEGSLDLIRDGEWVTTLEAPSPVAFVGISGGIEEIPGDIVAASNVTLLQIPRESLNHIWENSPAILFNTLRLSGARTFTDRQGWPFAPGAQPSTELGEYPAAALTFIERLQSLRSSGIFTDANLEALAELAKLRTEKRFPAGTQIWCEGDPSGYYLHLRYGVVVVSQGDKRVRVGGDYTMGFFESLGQLPRGYSVTAETEVVASIDDLEVMLSVFEDHPSLAVQVLSIVSLGAVKRLWKLE